MGDATLGWSTSARWERRTSSEAKALHKHEARDLATPGRGHRNATIDPARIGDNQVYVTNDDGELVKSTSPGDWARAIDRNLARVKGARWDAAEGQWYDEITRKGKTSERKRRADKTEVIDVVLQLDPKFTGPIVAGDYPVRDDNGHVVLDDDGNEVTQWHDDMSVEKREECERLLMTMVGTMAEKVGWHNVVGVAIQWDETHPHAHMQLTPIDDAGKLDWKSFIDGPVATSKFHDRFRLDLQAQGYHATMERVSDGSKHLGDAKFKARRDAERQARQETVTKEAKARAKLTVAEQDVAQAMRDRQAAKVELAAAQQDRAQAKDELAEVVELRRSAKADGHREGYKDGRAQAEDDAAEMLRLAAEQRKRAERAARLAELQRESAQEALQAAQAQLDAIALDRKELQRFFERLAGFLKKQGVKISAWNEYNERLDRLRKQAVIDSAEPDPPNPPQRPQRQGGD